MCCSTRAYRSHVRLDEICLEFPSTRHVYARSHVVLAWSSLPFSSRAASARTPPLEVVETLVKREGYIDRRAHALEPLHVAAARASAYLLVLHRSARGQPFRTLARTRFRVGRCASALYEPVRLELLGGRVRLHFRITAVPSRPPVVPDVPRRVAAEHAAEAHALLLEESSHRRRSPERSEDRVSQLYQLLSRLGEGGGDALSRRYGGGDNEIELLVLELRSREQERAETEERLCAAFGEIIRELQMKVDQLTSERDVLAATLRETQNRAFLKPIDQPPSSVADDRRTSQLFSGFI
ncbi:hypothetical protein AB1Y20_022009 [Prymnesium parvum]|uniref:Uncharacterized protein n=1 Tax=Prymnesium parvum TaxID=97485 RepID=A0AB34JEP0_PRYPA